MSIISNDPEIDRYMKKKRIERYIRAISIIIFFILFIVGIIYTIWGLIS